MSKNFKFQVSWLKDRFYEVTNIMDFLETKKNDEMLNWCLMTDEELKSNAQMRAYRQLVGLFSKAPECSLSYTKLHEKYKSAAGLIYFDKKPMSDDMLKIQRKVYSMLEDHNLKKELNDFINQGTVHYQSAAEATKGQLSMMIQLVKKDIADSGFTSKKVEQVLATLER